MNQTEKLYELLKDNKPHRTNEILEFVYGHNHLGIARIASRIHDLKKFAGVEIKGWKDKDNRALYWYQIKGKNVDNSK